MPISVVVDLLVSHWRMRLANLDGYLWATFGVPAPSPRPVRLHLSQMADGSVHPENIGHMFAAVWVVEDCDIREAPLNFEWRTRWDTDDSGDYYRMPAYSFVAEAGELLLSERFGPRLVHRSHGRLLQGAAVAVEWTTLWHTAPSLFAPPVPQGSSDNG